MKAHFDPVSTLKGKFAPPADKSISHRAAIFSAMCDEPVTISNYLDVRGHALDPEHDPRHSARRSKPRRESPAS